MFTKILQKKRAVKMKKVFAVILCFAIVYMIGAAASQYSANPGSVSINISTKVEAGYVVEIPPDISISYGSTSTDFSLNIAECKLEENQYLLVTLSDSQRSLVATEGSGAIPYDVLYQGNTFTNTKIYSAQKLAFKLNISETEWKNAPIADYKGTMTFTFTSGIDE